MSEETLCLKQLGRPQTQAIVGVTENEITPKQTPNTPNPPTKIDVMWDLYKERERLKQIREQVSNGERESDDKLKAEMYITQLVISADKHLIDALKETNINLTQNNFTQVDISTQVKDLIQFSRERQWSKNKPEPSS